MQEMERHREAGPGPDARHAVAPPAELVRKAEDGDADAQNAIGRWYVETGDDAENAERWFRRAADRGLARALHNMGVLALRADRLQDAVVWFGRAVSAGWVPSMYALGSIYEDSALLDQAVALYRRAADQGDGDSQDALGRMAFETEPSADHVASLYWSMKAADQGIAAAQTRLGTIYHEGLGVDRDPGRAAFWFLQAARQGHPGAQMMIGGFCHLGIGIQADRIEAVRWLSRSSLQGNPLARAYLGRVLGELTPEERTVLDED